MSRSLVFVGWAKRSVPTNVSSEVTNEMVGTAQARLCPPYEFYASLSLVAVDDGTSTGSSDGINRVRSRSAGIAR